MVPIFRVMSESGLCHRCSTVSMRHLDACADHIYFQPCCIAFRRAAGTSCVDPRQRHQANTGSFTMQFSAQFSPPRPHCCCHRRSLGATPREVAALIGRRHHLRWSIPRSKKATGSCQGPPAFPARWSGHRRPSGRRHALRGLRRRWHLHRSTIATDGKATMKSKLDTMLAKGSCRDGRLQPGGGPPARDGQPTE